MALCKQPSHDFAKTCSICQGRDSGFCCLIHSDPAAALATRKQTAAYQAGEEVAVQGDACDRIGVIASGLIKLVMITEDGENHLLQLLKPGQIIGDPCKAENAFSWEAATLSEICWINRQSLYAIMKDRPQIYEAFLEVTARQLEDHRLWVAAMRGRNTLQRIAFWLVQQMPDNNRTGLPVISIALTRRDLASLLDMTVETLCRGLHHLADRQAISLLAPDQVLVTQIDKLRVFAKCVDSRVTKALRSQDTPYRPENPFCITRDAGKDGAWSGLDVTPRKARADRRSTAMW